MKYSKTKGYKYKLEADEKILLSITADAYNGYISLDKGILIIKKAYLWDGSSIPFKKYLGGLWDFDKYCKRASLVHDAISQLMREGLLSKDFKEYADGLYRDMCIKGGMRIGTANRRYKYLRKFGDPYIQREKHTRDEIFEI